MSQNIDDIIIYDIFLKYCYFGNRNIVDEKRPNPNTLLMDGSKFAKLTREAGIVDEKLNSISVDIIFSKVKNRGERKISYNQFRTAINLLSEEKYHEEIQTGSSNKNIIEERIFSAIRNIQGPRLSQTTKPEDSQILDRLMDGPVNYISKSPQIESRAWKDDLRRKSSPISANNSSKNTTPNLKKSSPNPNQISRPSFSMATNRSPLHVDN